MNVQRRLEDGWECRVRIECGREGLLFVCWDGRYPWWLTRISNYNNNCNRSNNDDDNEVVSRRERLEEGRREVYM